MIDAADAALFGHQPNGLEQTINVFVIHLLCHGPWSMFWSVNDMETNIKFAAGIIAHIWANPIEVMSMWTETMCWSRGCLEENAEEFTWRDC